ncbi:MAG TPA: glutathione peroxidase [Chitinophagaceae bacterium]|jgi:glutathione peroxidase|nr:glutathione peroxidase [Chitinophagaceae bacterium]HPH23025.1 glutathione peroxidase [Chitinophagaceae bacterium]
MKRNAIIYLVLIFFITASFNVSTPKSIYQFKVPSIEGDVIDFSKFKGKKIMVVNTASKCEYTYQFTNLQNLYNLYKNKLVIVAFPSDQFNEESESGDDINMFCKVRYGVTFPVAEKTPILGDSASPVYKWLCSKKENGVMDVKIKWSFNKFLLDEKGKIIAHFASNVKPDSDEVLKYLK